MPAKCLLEIEVVISITVKRIRASNSKPIIVNNHHKREHKNGKDTIKDNIHTTTIVPV